MKNTTPYSIRKKMLLIPLEKLESKRNKITSNKHIVRLCCARSFGMIDHQVFFIRVAKKRLGIKDQY